MTNHDTDSGSTDSAHPEASLLWPIVLALLAWAGFGAAMAILPQLQGEAPPAWAPLIARTGKLLAYSKEFFLGPLILLLAIGAFSRLTQHPRPIAHALRDGLRFGAMAFGASAVLWTAIAAWSSFVEGEDPWASLPGITPPYLDTFLARHPELQTTTYGGTRTLRLHDSHGHSAFIDGDDLTDAAVRFEPCAAADLDAATLGGIAPYPGARCDTRLSIHRGSVERVIHVFVAKHDDSHEKIRQHFEGWAESLGAQHGYSGGPNHYFFTAHKDDKRWDLRLFVGRSRATEIYIPRGGRTLPWPGAKDEQWSR